MATAPWSRSLIVALLAPTSLLLSAPAFANDEAVKVSGKMWVSYSLDLTDSEAMANEFDVDRAYLTFKKNIGDNVTTRLTLDVGRDKDQTTSFVDSLGTEVELDTPQDPRLHAFVKYAYVGWKASDEVELRLGSAQTPYVSFAGKIWGHRFLSKVFIASVGLQGGADLGVHALGNHAEGQVSWQAAVMNGGGHKKAEDDLAKRAQLRVTVDPLADGGSRLPITLYGGTEVGGPDDPQSFGLGSVGFKSDMVAVLVDYLMVFESGSTGQGVGLALVPSIPDIVDFPVRVDWYDPNTDIDADSATRVLAGLSRTVAKKVRVAGVYERTTPEDAPDFVEHGVVARVEAGF